MLARLHAFVQHADEFDQVRRDHPIIENMNRMFDLVFRIAKACMTKVDAADASQEFAAILGRWAFWIVSDLSHCCGDDCAITAFCLRSPSLLAATQDL